MDAGAGRRGHDGHPVAGGHVRLHPFAARHFRAAGAVRGAPVRRGCAGVHRRLGNGRKNGRKELETMEREPAAVRVAISGYYGFGNSGDEAVLEAMLSALEKEGKREGLRVEPVVLSADPDKTARRLGVEAAHRMRPKDLWNAIRRSEEHTSELQSREKLVCR